MRRALLTAGALALLLGPAPLRADRLHLSTGGVIDVEQWWEEDDRVVYRGPAGTVALPRELVVRIERSTVAPSAASPSDPRPAAATPPRGADSASPWPTREQRRESEARDLMARANAALEQRKFDEASDLFWQVFQRVRSANGARVGYALAEMALGRNERALPVVLEGLALDPASAELHELLGDLRNREEFVEDAVRSWETAFQLAPNDRLRDKILKGQRELHAGRDYDFTATAHFNFRYDGQVEDALLQAVTDHLEQAYRQLSYVFHHSPAQPITVVLYPNRKFRAVTLAPERVAGLYDGKIRVPLGGLQRLDPQAKMLLTHELTHAVLRSKTRGNCPRWLHEGLAQRMEGRQLGLPQRREVRELLQAVAPERWAEGELSYPSALALVRHLESLRGMGGLVAVLDGLAAGRDVDDALRDVYGEGYAEICARWAGAVFRGEFR